MRDPSVPEGGRHGDGTRGKRLSGAPARTHPRLPVNPRKRFDPERLKELTDSIRQDGVLEPILVRPVDAGTDGSRFEIVAGERRFRAATDAQWRDPGHRPPSLLARPDDGRDLAEAAASWTAWKRRSPATISWRLPSVPAYRPDEDRLQHAVLAGRTRSAP